MKFKKIFAILSLLLIPYTLISQYKKVTEDFGVWAGLNIEKKFFNSLRLNIEQQIRYYTNATEFDDYLIDLGARYKINKNFRIASGFRYTYDAKRWRDTRHNYRYNLDFSYIGRLTSSLKLYYRFKYQKEYVDPFTHYHFTSIHSSDARNRLKLKYSLVEKNNIYISGEIFRHFEAIKNPYYRSFRIYFGDELDLKFGILNCSIGYDQEINTEYPLSFFFLKTIYTLEL